jgi:hypothetical protein
LSLAKSIKQNQGGNRSSEENLNSSLDQLFTIEELFEYQLRSSPLAYKLRQSGFDFSENEFRDVFSILNGSDSLDNADTPFFTGTFQGVQSLTPVLEKIKLVLGPDRFQKYLKLQDPIYKILQALAAQSGSRQIDFEAVYRVISQSSLRLSEIQSRSPVLTPELRSKIFDVTRQRDADLAKYLDKQSYDLVYRSIPMLNASVEMQSGTRGIRSRSDTQFSKKIMINN